MIAALLGLALLDEKPIQALFVGNSHTHVNDVPRLVQSLLHSDRTERKMEVTMKMVGFLEDHAGRTELDQVFTSKKWDVIVLQAAKVSSSHKYRYSQAEGIRLAKLAVKSGAKTFLFAEWPRKNWSETDYILGVYKEISEPAGATLIPVGQSFDRALKANPRANLWAGDGNHANLAGSYLAAATIYRSLFGPEGKPSFVPKGLSAGEAEWLLGHSKPKAL